MQALKEQLVFELKRFKTPLNSVESLFIGGGTPSTIDPILYLPLFELLKPYLQKNAEITTEANPNSASKSWLKGMKNLGINRISFGVQSFNAGKLKALNRAHTSQQAEEAILYAQKLGIKHLSLDLIYNYQGDNKKILLKDIEQAFNLPIDHISAYELTIEDGTKFANTPSIKQNNDELAFFVSEEIEKRGFKAYEISNFGTHQSKHNQGYWQGKDYIGAGAGAVGFLENKRLYPLTNIDQYIKNPFQITEEILNPYQLLTEKIFLGLRSNIGIKKSILSSEMLQRAEYLCKEGKLLSHHTFYINENFFLADELSLFILG